MNDKWDHRVFKDDKDIAQYYRQYWKEKKEIRSYCILERKDLSAKYWVSPLVSGDTKDIGPFDTFDEAHACLITQGEVK